MSSTSWFFFGFTRVTSDTTGAIYSNVRLDIDQLVFASAVHGLLHVSTDTGHMLTR